MKLKRKGNYTNIYIYIHANIDVGDNMYVRTTIKLREDIYQALKKGADVKAMSDKINEILHDALFKESKSLFGTMQKMDISDLRGHEDRI